MKAFLLKLPQDIHTDLKVLAFKQGVTMQEFILETIKKEIKSKK